MQTMIDKRKMTAKEAAESLGISERTVRRYCESGCPGAEFHAFPGTAVRGVYLLTERSVKWLREHVPSCKRRAKRANEDSELTDSI